jgi:uncharacterized membrane protein
MRKRRKKKKAKAKTLEGKLEVFLGLLAGGFGASLVVSNFQNTITGNVIGGVASSGGILGILLVLVGVAGTYFYFKN